MARFDLTDAEWAILEPLLPAQGKRLILIQAQTTPGTPPPTELPRFNLGLPPDGQSWTPPHNCGGGDLVDGQSHQSDPTQYEFELHHPFEYCAGQEWILGADSGIHPNRDGYAGYAATLANVVDARARLPQLPVTSPRPGR